MIDCTLPFAGESRVASRSPPRWMLFCKAIATGTAETVVVGDAATGNGDAAAAAEEAVVGEAVVGEVAVGEVVVGVRGAREAEVGVGGE